MWKSLLFVSLLLLLPQRAEAQWTLDKRAVAEDGRVVAWLMQSAGTPAIVEAVGREIGIAMYEDNRLTAAEADLFRELLGNHAGPMTITSPAGDQFQVPPLSQGARDFLALSDPPDLDTLWLQGPEEMKKLLMVTVLNPNIRIQVQHFVGNMLYASWRLSTPVNNYGPLRDTLNAAWGQWRLAGPETTLLARGMIYDAMDELDQAVKDAVPDEMYSWLKS